MGLNPRIAATVTRRLYAGKLMSVRLLKRGDNQRQNEVKEHRLFDVRRSRESKTGETIQGSMDVQHRATWHVPARELRRLGITHLNPLDRIVADRDQSNVPITDSRQWTYWQPTAETMIDLKLWNEEIDLECERVDPPR